MIIRITTKKRVAIFLLIAFNANDDTKGDFRIVTKGGSVHGS